MSIRLKIIDAIEKELSGYTKGAHTLDHVKRVHTLCLKLLDRENVDMRVLEAAALLHDIGRAREQETGISHSILSGNMSRDILREVGFTESECDKVVAAIRTHRFSEGIKPTSLEGQILSDADKLDAIGAIGIYRSIAEAVTTERGIEGFLKHADEKLLKLHDLMYTKKAKQIAKERHVFLDAFVIRLREEISKPD